MSSVFVSGTLVALGPYAVLVVILIFSVLLGLAVWLCIKPKPWRVGLALLIVLCIALQLSPLVVQ